MKSSQRKASRALVLGVGGVVAVGTVFWLGRITGNRESAGNEPAPNRSTALAADGSTLPATPKVEARLAATTAPATPTLGSPVASTQPAQTDLLIASTSQPTIPHAGADRSAAQDSISTNPLADAQKQIEANRPLQARKTLTGALVAGNLSAQDVKSAKQLLDRVNAQLVFSSKHFADDPFATIYTVPPGGVLAKIAASHDVTAEMIMRINGISDPRKLRADQTLKIPNGPFHALVRKNDFVLELWLGEPEAKGSMYVISYPVGLGASDSTPTGVWAIKNKLKDPTYYSPRGEGVIDASDPKNPLGEFWIGLTGTDGHAVGKSSYGIHGTIDPASIGKQESMGCIRLKNEDVAQVYAALVEGKSTVTVKD